MPSPLVQDHIYPPYRALPGISQPARARSRNRRTCGNDAARRHDQLEVRCQEQPQIRRVTWAWPGRRSSSPERAAASAPRPRRSSAPPGPAWYLWDGARTALKAQADVVVRAGGEAVAVPADLAGPGTPSLIASACRDRFGRIDGVVNNAAVVRHKPLADWDVAGFNEHVATNVGGRTSSSRPRCRT